MAISPPSFRYPFANLAKLPPEARDAHLATFNALTDIYQALALQKQNSSTNTTTVNETVLGTSSTSTASGVSSFNGATGAVTFFPDIFLVNNQTGVTTYTTQTADAGAFIVLNDASPIAIGLNYTVATNWATWIANYGAGAATLTPTLVPSGATSTITYPNNIGASSMPLPSGFAAIISFDGQNFWAIAIPITIAIPIPVAQGGTGATTPAGARTNLGAAASGANSDITSLTGLTTPLPVSEGGTGTTTPALVPGTNVTITGTWPNQTINASTTGLSATIITAALTIGGTQGSQTFTNGLLTAQTPAT